MKTIQKALISFALPFFLSGAHAQASDTAEKFPEKGVRIVLPYTPGGSSDALARFIGEKLAGDWKQSVIIENRPGASGMIGTEIVSRGPADGYTALFAITQHIQNPLLYKKVAYDPLKDFSPLARILTVPTALAVTADFPANTIQEMIALVRSQPNIHSFGSTGNASTSHIYGGLLAKRAELKAVHVPYKGAGPLLTDLLGKQITFTILDVGSLMPLVKAGKLKILTVAGTERVSYLSSTPTFAESGFAGFEALSWMGLFLPASTPQAVRQKWMNALQRHLTSAEMANKLLAMGMASDYLNAANFETRLANDTLTWKSVISAAQVSAE